MKKNILCITPITHLPGVFEELKKYGNITYLPNIKSTGLRQILKEDSSNLNAQPGISAQLIVSSIEGSIGRYIRSKFKDSPSIYIENVWELLSLSIFKN